MKRLPILPISPEIVTLNGSYELDYKAICLFAATGFFLGRDTYFTNQKVLDPGRVYRDENDFSGVPYFRWHYSPRNISFKQVTEEFSHLFEQIVQETTGDKRVILALSGGLDSRSLATALRGCRGVHAYSYKFANSFNETKYGDRISRVMGWQYDDFIIPKGYLWNVIEDLASINGCYAEFTAPRQMAIADRFSDMGDIFCLGHMGDLLFDNMGLPDHVNEDEQVALLKRLVVKKGGAELGNALWRAWGLSGCFEDYLDERIYSILSSIEIDNANARLRAFKSSTWVPRWTSVNLSIFKKYHPLSLPYYDDRMCEFICSVPEHFLANRQIQIEYIKQKTPELASISWQSFDPCNLYDYGDYRKWFNVPRVLWPKIQRRLKMVSTGRVCTERNWEIQFLGSQNDAFLRSYLFDNRSFSDFIPQGVVSYFYNRFKSGCHREKVWFSHSICMLLTLSLFAKRYLS